MRKIALNSISFVVVLLISALSAYASKELRVGVYDFKPLVFIENGEAGFSFHHRFFMTKVCDSAA